MSVAALIRRQAREWLFEVSLALVVRNELHAVLVEQATEAWQDAQILDPQPVS